MSIALSSLSASIQATLNNRQESVSRRLMIEFTGLKQANAELSRRFDQAEKALAPPREKRLQALANFRRQLPLTGTEWRLVFAALSDHDERLSAVLEDDPLFGRVHEEVQERIRQSTLNRRDWLALCFSYFAYDNDTPEANRNWQLLRGDIDQGFEVVKRAAKREKEWMRVVAHHRELFGDAAGSQLAEEIFAGKARDLSALQTIAQVPDSSWLWRRIFAVLLSRIFQLADEPFRQRLPELVDLGQLNSRYLDQVLSACLTRYFHSRFREESSDLLKQLSLDQWGSPQMRSRQNAWLQYVEQPVCAMVVAWLAKEDLQHFFTLLQGESGVDRNRLNYWIKHVGLMSYTRIVLGSGAADDPSPDFVEFRRKNRARLSYLQGGTAEDNAFIMQIGQYFFVEFSRKGNACYFYNAENLPFKPESHRLSLNTELKRIQYIAASGTSENKFTHSGGWESKADEILRRLGIVAQKNTNTPATAASRDLAHNKWQQLVASAARNTRNSAAQKMQQPQLGAESYVEKAGKIKDAIDVIILKAEAFLRTQPNPPKSLDRRHDGGAFWVLENENRPTIHRELTRLTFRHVPGKGYWIK